MFNLYLNNYRGFIHQEFKFSKINILIGENSAGKSSVIKFLLSIKQSLENPEEMNFKFSGQHVDLGNYSEVVIHNKTRRQISFAFEFNNAYAKFYTGFMKQLSYDDAAQKEIHEIIRKYGNSTTRVEYKINSRLHDHSTIQTKFSNPLIGSLEIRQHKSKSKMKVYRTCDLLIDFYDEGISEVIEDVFMTKEAFTSLIHPDILEQCNKLFLDKGLQVFYRIAFFLLHQNFLITTIRDFEYINPIGTSPKRFYFKEDKKDLYLKNDLNKFINFLSNSTGKKGKHGSIISKLNSSIKSLGIADEVRIQGNSDIPVVGLEVRIKDLWSNVTDVGYGVSLQLPILLQAIMSNNEGGKYLLIEQPEVHLHPALQAKFIKTLLEVGPANKYFIETHSEHIVRMLQVLVKTKKVKPDDISIYYFKRTNDKFGVSEHSILPNGKLNPQFPEGFYDVSYNLVKELL